MRLLDTQEIIATTLGAAIPLTDMPPGISSYLLTVYVAGTNPAWVVNPGQEDLGPSGLFLNPGSSTTWGPFETADGIYRLYGEDVTCQVSIQALTVE